METEPISVLVRTKNWQSLYGVRRSNFRAYRNFCQRRSKKIRKSLHVSFGKKFVKDKFEAALCRLKDPEKIEKGQVQRLVEVCLLLAEKNFAVYLESKQSPGNPKKRVVKKKLRSALRYVDRLMSSFSPFLPNRSALELNVYRATVAAALFLEQKDFAKAKEEYLRLTAVLKQIIDTAAAVEKAQLEELLEGAKQSLRYCRFQLRDFDAREEKDALVIRNYEDLTQLLEKVSEAGTTGGRKINLFGSTLEIDDPKILALLQKEELLLASLASNQGSEGFEEIFWALVNNSEEGIKVCHKNRIDAGNNVSLGRIWSSLDSLFAYKKDFLLLKRTLKMFATYERRFEDLTQGSKKAEERRPQESIKQLETLLAHLRKLVEIGAKFERQSPLLNLLETFFRTKKCLFICQLYYNNKCYKEALSLGESQVGQLTIIKATLTSQRDKLGAECAVFDEEHNHGQEYSFTGLVQAVFAEMESLAQKMGLLIKQAKVGLFDEGQTKVQQLDEEMAGIELGRPNDRSRNINCLLDLVVENRESTIKEQMDFIKIPPVAQLISNKPIFLDIVWNYVEYPSLPQGLVIEEKKAPAKGFFGSIFGRK